eukprot:353273-Chlamydomonas_euryale.AAC.5
MDKKAAHKKSVYRHVGVMVPPCMDVDTFALTVVPSHLCSNGHVCTTMCLVQWAFAASSILVRGRSRAPRNELNSSMIDHHAITPPQSERCYQKTLLSPAPLRTIPSMSEMCTSVTMWAAAAPRSTGRHDEENAAEAVWASFSGARANKHMNTVSTERVTGTVQHALNQGARRCCRMNFCGESRGWGGGGRGTRVRRQGTYMRQTMPTVRAASHKRNSAGVFPRPFPGGTFSPGRYSLAP